MKTAIISFSDIVKHPTNRMDAEYHVGKKNGKKAYKKDADGLVVENDNNGKIMLYETEATEYNDTKKKINELNEKIAPLSNKVNNQKNR